LSCVTALTAISLILLCSFRGGRENASELQRDVRCRGSTKSWARGEIYETENPTIGLEGTEASDHCPTSVVIEI